MGATFIVRHQLLSIQKKRKPTVRLNSEHTTVVVSKHFQSQFRFYRCNLFLFRCNCDDVISSNHRHSPMYSLVAATNTRHRLADWRWHFYELILIRWTWWGHFVKNDESAEKSAERTIGCDMEFESNRSYQIQRSVSRIKRNLGSQRTESSCCFESLLFI